MTLNQRIDLKQWKIACVILLALVTQQCYANEELNRRTRVSRALVYEKQMAPILWIGFYGVSNHSRVVSKTIARRL